MNKSRLVIAVLILLVNFGLQAELYSIEEQNGAPRSYSPLNETDISQIKELLAEAKLLPQSLNYEKDWDLSTRQKSAWHMNALQKPLSGIEQVGGLREVCADSSDAGLAVTMNHFANIAWGTGDAIEVYAESYFAYLNIFTATVKKPKDLFTFWDKVLNGLDSEIAAVYADIPAASLDSLTAFFFTAFAENEDKEKFVQLLSTRKLPNSDSLETDALERMFKGINHDFLYISALKYYAATQVMKKGAAKLLYTNKKPLVKLTKHGTMIIGTVIADTYDSYEISALAKSPLCLLIEPAGNDIYEMSLNTSKDYCTYLLIDYSGDDVYRSKTPASMFFSLLGHGISYDIKGDDLYQNDDYTFSSFIGTNLHMDYKGNDTYHSGLFSQGASMQGIAMLVDVTGNDTYTATTLAQGLGSVCGVGAMLDYSGADVYQLGGKYFHAPLMPDDYRSMGQGMGFGIRPDFAGGLGLVYDKYGNDKYIGGVYAQGVGYWYATGVLIDEAGNDVYNAIYYPQGSGIHLACGFLYDGGGNDAYYSRHGPGEGAGHDWGFGALIDASGNDAYSIQGGNGLGLSNSVGIFVDKQGDDRYERNDASNYGNGAFARSTGGIGLFLDMGGKDVYPDSTKINDSTWQKGTYGIGRDIEIYSPAPVAAEVQAGDDPLVAADAPIAEVFSAAAEWEVGSAIKRVREARKMLTSRSEEALPYILAKKMNTNSALDYRALEAFLNEVPAFHARLFEFVEDADSLKAKTAMSLIAGVKDSTLIVPIRKHLENKRYITACISLLGSIKSDESVQILSTYAVHPSERYRYIAARSLKDIGSKAAFSVLKSMDQDESFLVQALIRNLPEEKP